MPLLSKPRASRITLRRLAFDLGILILRPLQPIGRRGRILHSPKPVPTGLLKVPTCE